jgi:hypothetical protein
MLFIIGFDLSQIAPIRRNLGDYGQISSPKLPPKPRATWRRTYAQHCAALASVEHKLQY